MNIGNEQWGNMTLMWAAHDCLILNEIEMRKRILLLLFSICLLRSLRVRPYVYDSGPLHHFIFHILAFRVFYALLASERRKLPKILSRDRLHSFIGIEVAAVAVNARVCVCVWYICQNHAPERLNSLRNAEIFMRYYHHRIFECFENCIGSWHCDGSTH